MNTKQHKLCSRSVFSRAPWLSVAFSRSHEQQHFKLCGRGTHKTQSSECLSNRWIWSLCVYPRIFEICKRLRACTNGRRRRLPLLLPPPPPSPLISFNFSRRLYDKRCKLRQKKIGLVLLSTLRANAKSRPNDSIAYNIYALFCECVVDGIVVVVVRHSVYFTSSLKCTVWFEEF